MIRHTELLVQPNFPGQLTAQRIGKLVSGDCREQAAEAILEGNPGFGAAITDLVGLPLATGHNTTRTDPSSLNNSAHAEMNADREYQRRYGQGLADCCVFSNAISCAMCFDNLLERGARRFFYGDYCSATSKPWLSLPEMRDHLVAAPRGAEEGWLVVGIFSKVCRTQIEIGRLALTRPGLRAALKHDYQLLDQVNELENSVVMGPAVSPGTEHIWFPGIQAWPAERARDEALLAQVRVHYDDEAAHSRLFRSSLATSTV